MMAWHTSNLRLATFLAIYGECWPRSICKGDGRHLELVYDQRPPQELLDVYLSGNGDTVNRVLDAYHTLRYQVSQARDLGADEATFRLP